MKILIVSQYFWPENFRINDLASELSIIGHKVTVLTGYPNYPDGTIYHEFQRNSSSFNSSEDIVPAECLPTASNTSTTVTSLPLNFPGKIEPP